MVLLLSSSLSLSLSFWSDDCRQHVPWTLTHFVAGDDTMPQKLAKKEEEKSSTDWKRLKYVAKRVDYDE